MRESSVTITNGAQVLNKGWFTVPRDRAKSAFFTKQEIAKSSFANARGIGQHRVKHWLQLTWRG